MVSPDALPAAALSLHTRRLHLRWLTAGDAAFMLRVWTDPAFMRYVGDRGIRTQDAAASALEDGILATYRQFGYGPYLVCLTETGEAIGICGLFRRPYLADPDIGFALLPGYTGAGYAREAAEAVIGQARFALGLTRITAIVAPENRPSVALIEKLGLRYERMLRLEGDERGACLYAVEWEPVT